MMTLREFIEVLQEMVEDDPNGEALEVVAIADDGEEYTPVIAVGPGKDGVRRISVA